MKLVRNKVFIHIRKKARGFLLDLLSLESDPKPGIHILNGHFLSEHSYAPMELFYRQLNTLLSNGVGFINFDQAVSLIKKEELPDDRCLVAFTFDDGFEECYTKIRPVLNDVGIKAGFFINPGFIDGDDVYQKNFKENIVFTEKPPMTWEQVIVLKNEGHIIGSHTMDHTMLGIQNDEVLEYQLGESKKQIEQRLNANCEYFAFPYGRPEHMSQSAIETAGKHYRYIFSQSNYQHYYSFGKKVINRRHFECNWPYKHVIYFLKTKKM